MKLGEFEIVIQTGDAGPGLAKLSRILPTPQMFR